MVKVAFLDRDGVINKKAPEGEYILSWDEFQFKEGSAQAIKLLNEHGYKVVVVTNQRGIARGLMSGTDLMDIHNKMRAMLKEHNAIIDAIYYCPHDKGQCDCRKPDIGMFKSAEERFNVDKPNSFMIGDSISDIVAGERYGVVSYLLSENQSLKNLIEKII